MSVLHFDVEVDCAPEVADRHPELNIHDGLTNIKNMSEKTFCDSGVGESLQSADFQSVDCLKQDMDNLTLKEPIQESEEPSEDTDSETTETFRNEEKHVDSRIVFDTTSVYAADDDGDTQLHLAIIHYFGALSLKFITMATSHHQLSAQNVLSQTPLHLATILKQAPIIRKLVAGGSELELRDRRGNTPLHLACQYADLECVYQLTAPITLREVQQFSYDVPFQRIPQDVDWLNYEGMSCLHLAASRCDYEIMNHLLRIGADINVEDGKSGRTVLHIAVENHNTRMVQYMLNQGGVNVNALTFDRSSPLSLAMGRGYQDLVTLLVSNGASYSVLQLKGDDSDAETSDDIMIDDFKIGGEPLF